MLSLTVLCFFSTFRARSLWCIYGYSLTAFIPVSLACVIPVEGIRWAVVAAATLLSGSFLFANIKATVFATAPAKASALLLVMMLAHVGLGVALKLFFFQYAH